MPNDLLVGRDKVVLRHAVLFQSRQQTFASVSDILATPLCNVFAHLVSSVGSSIDVHNLMPACSIFRYPNPRRSFCNAMGKSIHGLQRIVHRSSNTHPFCRLRVVVSPEIAMIGMSKMLSMLNLGLSVMSIIKEFGKSTLQSYRVNHSRAGLLKKRVSTYKSLFSYE